MKFWQPMLVVQMAGLLLCMQILPFSVEIKEASPSEGVIKCAVENTFEYIWEMFLEIGADTEEKVPENNRSESVMVLEIIDFDLHHELPEFDLTKPQFQFHLAKYLFLPSAFTNRAITIISPPPKFK